MTERRNAGIAGFFQGPLGGLGRAKNFVSPSGKVEVKWPWALGGHWEIVVGGLKMLSGFRRPGSRRPRWLIWGLDATARVLSKPPVKLMESEEVEQISKLVGKPMPDGNPRGLPKGTPPTGAALARAKALGWSEH